MPTVANSLGTDLIGISWALLAYQIPNIGLSIVFGRVSDLWGREKVFGLGFLVFSLSSLLCGLSSNVVQLILSRFVQGVGGAMLQSPSRALAAESVPEELAGRAQGYMTTAHHVGFVLGPSIGGLMIDYLSWRWSFFLLVPIGLCGTLLTLASLRRRAPASQHHNVSIDYLGATLLVATTTMLVLIFDRRTHEIIGANMKIALALLLVGCFTTLIIHESKAHSPIVDLSLFRIRRFSFSVVSLLIIAMCYSLIGFLMPFYLQDILHLSATAVGLLFMAPSILTVAFAPLSGYMSDRFGPRAPATLGAAIMVASLSVGGLLGTESLLVSTSATDHPERDHQRHVQSGEFHGDDRHDAQRASWVRFFDESRDLWSGECARHRPRRLCDGDCVRTFHGNSRSQSDDRQSRWICRCHQHDVLRGDRFESGSGGGISGARQWAAMSVTSVRF